MTSSNPTVDDSQPRFTIITLPVVANGEEEALLAAMARTMEHLGLLYYQVFLQQLEAHWPSELASLTVEHDGEGYVLLTMTPRPKKEPPRDDYDSLAAFRRRMIEVDYERPKSFYNLVANGFQRGQLRVERQDVAGLFLAALDEAQLARVQAATLDTVLPEANGSGTPKPKF